MPDAPWIGQHPDDYRDSLEPPVRDWDAEADCDRDEAAEGEDGEEKCTENQPDQ